MLVQHTTSYHAHLVFKETHLVDSCIRGRGELNNQSVGKIAATIRCGGLSESEPLDQRDGLRGFPTSVRKVTLALNWQEAKLHTLN